MRQQRTHIWEPLLKSELALVEGARAFWHVPSPRARADNSDSMAICHDTLWVVFVVIPNCVGFATLPISRRQAPTTHNCVGVGLQRVTFSASSKACTLQKKIIEPVTGLLFFKKKLAFETYHALPPTPTPFWLFFRWWLPWRHTVYTVP